MSNRKKTIWLGILNIVTHPHSPKRYVELIETAAKSRRKVQLAGDRYGMIATLARVNEKDPESTLEGSLVRFLDIDPKEPWFNVDSSKIATVDELKAVSIPQHLKPHSTTFRFVFFPKQHRLVFIQRDGNATISPDMVKDLFQGLLHPLRDEHNLESITVTVQQSLDQVEAIFKMAVLHSIEITLRRPNADFDPEGERALLENLENEQASQMVVNYIADSNGTLKLSEKTRTLAAVAAANGFVKADGKDADYTNVKIETSYHPMLKAHRYDPKANRSLIEWLRDAGEKLLANVKVRVKQIGRDESS